MTKEYDTRRITPENARENIDLFLKDARVGSVEFIAFCNALELRSTSVRIREYKRILEIMEGGGVIPELARPVNASRMSVESDLRMAETEHALVAFEGNKCGSSIPGYIQAHLYSLELIHDYEKHMVRTKSFGMDDPTLEEMRRRSEAFDYINESLHDIKMTDESTGAHWVTG